MMQFCGKRELSKATGLSDSTLKRYRLNGTWQKGIHWVANNPFNVRYNLPLILHWQATRECPEQHEAEIVRYLKSLEGGNDAA